MTFYGVGDRVIIVGGADDQTPAMIRGTKTLPGAETQYYVAFAPTFGDLEVHTTDELSPAYKTLNDQWHFGGAALRAEVTELEALLGSETLRNAAPEQSRSTERELRAGLTRATERLAQWASMQQALGRGNEA